MRTPLKGRISLTTISDQLQILGPDLEAQYAFGVTQRQYNFHGS